LGLFHLACGLAILARRVMIYVAFSPRLFTCLSELA
jgi:hypothetical protein